MKQRKVKTISCTVGVAMLFLLAGIFVLGGKNSHNQPAGDGTELRLLDTDYSEEERAQRVKQYEEEMVERALDMVDWTGREEEREQYREMLLQK